MNHKLNYSILLEVGKSLVTGLFPYVFLNNVPKKALNIEKPLNSLYDKSKDISCTKTKKKILYHHVPANNIWLNYVSNLSDNVKYNYSIYFNVNERNNNRIKSKSYIKKNFLDEQSPTKIYKKDIFKNNMSLKINYTKKYSGKKINFFNHKRFVNTLVTNNKNE